MRCVRRSVLTPDEMAGIACIELAHRQQHRQIRRIEVGVPRRGAADPCAGTQVALINGGTGGCCTSGRSLRSDASGSGQRGKRDTPAAHVLGRRLYRLAAACPPSANADAGAADQVFVPPSIMRGREPRPEQVIVAPLR